MAGSPTLPAAGAPSRCSDRASAKGASPSHKLLDGTIIWNEAQLRRLLGERGYTRQQRYAARSADEWDRLIGALDAFEAVETSAAHVARALQVQRLLAARSQRGRKLPDLLVAAAAEALNLTVLHYDADFEHISAVTGQAHQWVVPAGTVD